MRSCARTAILFMTLSLLSGCAIHESYGPYMGKVVDAETEEPIEGAVLFMEFYTLFGHLAGATSYYADAKEVLTDRNGEFFLEHSVTTFRPGQLWEPHPKIYIYKPGYGVFPWRGTSITPDPKWSGIDEGKYSVIKLPRLKTRAERLDAYNVIFLDSEEIPYKKRRHITSYIREERAFLGFRPFKAPEGQQEREQ